MCVLNFSNFSVFFLCVRARRVSYVRNHNDYITFMYTNRNFLLICIYTSNITLKCRAPYNIQIQKQHNTNTLQAAIFVSIIFVVSEVFLYTVHDVCWCYNLVCCSDVKHVHTWTLFKKKSETKIPNHKSNSLHSKNIACKTYRDRKVLL